MPHLFAVVLAAGQGTRMKSATAKVLHSLAGRPLIHYPVRAALEAGAEAVVVVVGYGAEQVRSYLVRSFDERVRTVVQAEQLGTGHAARVAMPALGDAFESTLVLYGDTPLLQAGDLRALAAVLDAHPEAPLALLTCVVPDPTGYGRVLRDAQGHVVAIREHRDCRSAEERAIQEINPGVYAARAAFLEKALSELEPGNAQRELYLTDIVQMAGALGGALGLRADASTLAGVNDRTQLAAAEAAMHRRIIERLGRAGVTLRGDPCIDDTVEVMPGATIGPGVVLRGATVVCEDAVVDAGCVITDSHVGPGAHIGPCSVITSSRIGTGDRVGPLVHLRPDGGR